MLGGAVGAAGFDLGRRSVETVSTVAPVPVATVAASTDDLTSDAPAVLIDGDEPAAAVARAVGPAVVQVETDFGQGSGVVYDDGLILTNSHVVQDATGIRIRSADGRVFEVELLGQDARNDIAVLSAPGADLPVAALGSTDDLEVGQLTVAIGSPFLLQQTVTSGIVSSLDRPVPNVANSYTAMIQTDAPINPGNSGGALANRSGEVIGINASIRTDGTSNSNVGIGFAIPIDTAVNVAERIVSGQSLEPGMLGVQGQVQDDGIGVPIATVVDDSAAAAAGLLPGDRIITVDGSPVTSIDEVIGLVQSHFSGDTIELVVGRDGQELTLSATLD